MSEEDISCSFCGRTKTQTEVLIAGLRCTYMRSSVFEQANGIILNER
jgi:hypothetical protein